MKTKEEELYQQGIGEADNHEPQTGIGTPAYHEPAQQQQGIGTPAYHEPETGIGTPASKNTAQQTTTTQPAATRQQPIKVMEGVTAGTQQKLGQLENGYQPGATAQSIQQQLGQLQTSKPGGYTSPYEGQLNSILAEITGQKPFQYSINQDALFQSLSDYYQQQAKQASLNAQGQAAGLTGGYGNSAAQLAGSQAYQQAILPMYDKAMDTAQFAYNVHQGDQQNKMNQLSALMNMDQTAYGRNRDEVGDWKDERDYLTGRYDTETNRDMQMYLNDLDYYMKKAQIENADYRSEQERQEAIRQFEMNYQADKDRFNWQKDVDKRDYDRGVLESDRNYAMNQQQLEEQIRQFNESLDWDKMSAEQKYAAEWIMQTLAMGQMPSDELLAAAGLTAEDAQKMMTKTSTGGPGGGKNVYYLDDQGNPYRQNADGSMTAVDPSTLKPGDQFKEGAGGAIGISNLVTGIRNATTGQATDWEKLLGRKAK